MTAVNQVGNLLTGLTGTGAFVGSLSPTITTPKIVNQINDTNGATIIGLTAIASAVNFLQITNNSTSNPVGISTAGSDTNVGMTFTTQGTGGYVFNGGNNTLLNLVQTASAVNYLRIVNNITGSPPAIYSEGSDSNIGQSYIAKGTGTFLFTSLATSNQITFNVGSSSLANSTFNFNSTTGNYTFTWPAVSGTVLLTAGTQQMASGAKLALDKSTGTESSNAVTINAQSGVITTVSLTTAQYNTESITLTNSEIATTSVVIASIMGGTNTTPGVTVSATAGNGSSVIVLTNTNSAALNGTVIIGFAVF